MAKKGAKYKKLSWKAQIFGILGVITAVVFMPTTIMLCFAMLPTVVAALVDKTKKGTKALTVGAMNLAGTTPFLIDLWAQGHRSDIALTIITDPRTIIVIYCAAGIGYLIDWAMTGIVATFMAQRGKSRIQEIEERQKALEKRWGREVSGDIPLDQYGFPIEGFEEDPQDAP